MHVVRQECTQCEHVSAIYKDADLDEALSWLKENSKQPCEKCGSFAVLFVVIPEEG